MSKISAIFPQSWLSVNIDITNHSTNNIDFTSTMSEVGTTWTYIYTFTPLEWIDYSWVATSPWYRASGILYADWTSTWGASVSDIWNAKIEDYSNLPWTFWTKFANYGWVSHVVNNNFNDEVKSELKKLIEDKISSIKIETPTVVKEVVKETPIDFSIIWNIIEEKLSKRLKDNSDDVDKIVFEVIDEFESIHNLIIEWYEQEIANLKSQLELVLDWVDKLIK